MEKTKTALQPKTLKFYLPTEVAEKEMMYVLEDGTLLTLKEMKQMVVPSKKNQKRAVSNKATGRAYIIPSEQYLTWMKEMSPAFDKFYLQAMNAGVRLPIVRCNITVLFYYPDTRNRDNHNKFETIADSLVAAGVLGDDSFQVIHETKLRGYTCRDKPRTEIYISIIEAGQPEYEWDITNEAKHREKLLERKRIQKKIQRDKAKREV
jgi:hypothetical protein